MSYCSNRSRRESALVVETLEIRQLMAGSDPIAPDELEPNNSFAAATNLGTTLNASVGALTIHRVNASNVDQDYFKFVASGSGIAQVRIDFFHDEGNLALRAYNSSQTQLAVSDSSSSVINHEDVAFAVTQGQTYYIRVSGVPNAEYSLSMSPITPTWDWQMAKRFGAELDQFGMPVIHNTADYVIPSPFKINDKWVGRYPTQFSASSGLGTGASYFWEIGNQQYSTTASGVNPTVDLPEGTYTAKLTVSAGGASVSLEKQVTVRNYLYVAIGDSYSSGEGNPHSPMQFDLIGNVTRGAIWANSTNQTENDYHRMAHRSAHAAVAQAALAMENADSKTSVTFVFLSHTGSTIEQGVLGDIASGDPAVPGTSKSQLERLKGIVGNRHIDGLSVSIGGNDIGFATILGDLVGAEPIIYNDWLNAVNNIFTTAETKMQRLANELYPNLARELDKLDVGQVFLTEYPDITKDSSGYFAEKILDDIQAPFEVDRNELIMMADRLMLPLQNVMRAASARFGWTYVDGVAAGFANHGYGDWFRAARQSVVIQGPLNGMFELAEPIVSTLRLKGTIGTMHPTSGGLTVVKDRIIDKVYRPDLAVTSFSLSEGALLGQTNGGSYSITFMNRSFTAAMPASTAQIALSPDANVTTSDFILKSIAVPALAPGESITLTGTLPVVSDPYRSAGNRLYVAPVLDVNGAAAESNEANNFASNELRMVELRSDRDLMPIGGVAMNGGSVVLDPISVPVNSTVNGVLGLDEMIGNQDIDTFLFDASAGQRIAFDVDAIDSMNLHLRIYRVVADPAGGYAIVGIGEVAQNDNAPAPGENPGTDEPFLRHTFAETGKYIAVITGAANASANPMTLIGRTLGPQGRYSLSLSAVVDATPPTVSSGVFDLAKNELKFQFSENVSAALASGVLQLKNITTGKVFGTSEILHNWDAITNTVTFRFPQHLSGLPDGNYTASLRSELISDDSGNQLSGDGAMTFFVLAGDANRDRKVDTQDFNVLAANFGGVGRTFAQGNFNYDQPGVVDSTDFAVLLSRYGQKLPAPSPAVLARGPSPFAGGSFGSHRAISDLLN